MFFSIASSQSSWLAGLALVLGTLAAVLGQKEVSISLISIGGTLATFKQSSEK